MTEPIYVTQPSLAPLSEYLPYLETIWRTGVMTHNGPMVQQLELALCRYLDVKNVICLANGTSAIQLSMHALEITGEVITSPFTFIATGNIIAWERCRPVFVDIDPTTWNLDAGQIEASITEKTSAILPVHVFSAPCDVESIQAVADKHGLKVIYDAAHAMAVDVGGKSLLRYGDISCVSFHATKLFNTAEGGACVTDDDELAARIRRLRFFGFDESKEITDDGMNAKMTEVHAGLGLANLQCLDRVRENRRAKTALYTELLGKLLFVSFQKHEADEYNYSYMPVVYDSEDRVLKILERLAREKVYPRRYFHPSLHALDIFESAGQLPVAERIAETIVCMPLYDTLSEDDIRRICRLVGEV